MDRKDRALRRIEKSKLNTKVTLITSIVMGVFSFAERTVFNQFFIDEYLGINSFINSIIYILSFLEMGLYSAVGFALYAPLEYEDQQQINAIMRFFRNAYFIIGTVMLTAGLALVPFMHMFIRTSVDINHVRVYFLILLVANVSAYYLNYTSILMNANQEQYKISLVTNLTWTVLYLAEMIIAVTTQNFLFYTIAVLIANLSKNIILRLIAECDFPLLDTGKKSGSINPEIKNRIVKNTKGLIITKLGSVLVTSTDALLISMLVGTAVLGKYSNYQMIYMGLFSISNLLPQSIIASLGNAGVTETKRTMSRGFEVLNLSSYFIYATLTIMMLNIYTPVISAFFGADRILPFSTVCLICMVFYMNSMREILLSYKASLGLYWEDRKRPILEGLTNLIISIILGYFWGLNGILLGTVITAICINLVIEPRVIFHEGFSRSAYWFYVSTVLRFLLAVIISVVSLSINSFLRVSERITFEIMIGSFRIGVGDLLAVISNAAVAVAVTIAFFLLFYRKTESVRIIIQTLKMKTSGIKK